MRDPAVFLWAIIGILFMAMLVAALVRIRHSRILEAAADKRAAQEKDKLEREQVAAGTHLRTNVGVLPKCLYCSDVATQKPFMWNRNQGIFDLIRRKLGAPAVVRIVRDKKAPDISCEAHDPLAAEAFRLELAEAEVDHAKLESTWETRRARFQREGVHERVREQIARHETEIGGRRKRAPKSNVVPISASKAGGA